MGYTLGQAAKAAGKSKTTILRALKKSKISGMKDAHGNWSIDPAELHRVYPAVTGGNGTAADDATIRNTEGNDVVRVLEARIEELRQDRDAWRDQAQRLLLARPDERRPFWHRLFDRGERRPPGGRADPG